MTQVSWRDAVVDVDADGTLALGTDGVTVLGRWRPTYLRQGATEVELGRPEISRLPDEVELSWTVTGPDGSGWTVLGRHSFGVVWSQRWVVRASPGAAVGLDPDPVWLRFAPAAGPAAVGWVFAAGVESSVAVLPYDLERPVLGLAVQQGGLAAVADQLELGPYALDGGVAGVVELRGELYPHAAAFGRTVHTWLPPTTSFASGELVVITHPDDGLVVDDPDPLATLGQPTPASGGSEFVAGSDSEQRLVFQGARGRTEVVLHWAKPLGEAIQAAADTVLTGRRATNGAPILPDPQAGLLVQRALADHAEIDPILAADALDRLAAHESDETPWQIMFDCAEFHRTGDDDQLIRAHRTLLASTASAGTGLAASRLVVALLSVGRNPAPVLQHLQQARQDPLDDDVRLELDLVIGTVLGAGHGDETASDSARQVGAVAARLGGGLRGRGWDDPPAVERARLVGLLSLLPELAVLWQDKLAVRPGRLAQYAANRVLYELPVGQDSTAADRQALVWLSLASDT